MLGPSDLPDFIRDQQQENIKTTKGEVRKVSEPTRTVIFIFPISVGTTWNV